MLLTLCSKTKVGEEIRCRKCENPVLLLKWLLAKGIKVGIHISISVSIKSQSNRQTVFSNLFVLSGIRINFIASYEKRCLRLSTFYSIFLQIHIVMERRFSD